MKNSFINGNKRIFVYGAGDVATEVAYCILNEPINEVIEAFVVSDTAGNEKQRIFGIPVISINDVDAEKDVQFVVAVLEKYRDEICDELKNRGFENIVCLTFESDSMSNLRRETFEVYKNQNRLSNVSYLKKINTEKKPNKNDVDSLCVYVARSHKDRILSSDIPQKKWEKDIQVGADMASKTIWNLKDNDGDNISKKNPYYCELTGLYWAWKNDTDSDYVGMSHYRRRFNFNDEDVAVIVNNEIDIVVTVPILNIPCVKAMYEKNHIGDDWERLRKTIQEICPEYVREFEEVENGIFYFAYNMFVMRRHCLNEYCQWLFALLEKCEIDVSERDLYQRRYVGFLAERLLSVYILHNIDKLKVVYADKSFYE